MGSWYLPQCEIWSRSSFIGSQPRPWRELSIVPEGVSGIFIWRRGGREGEDSLIGDEPERRPPDHLDIPPNSSYGANTCTITSLPDSVFLFDLLWAVLPSNLLAAGKKKKEPATADLMNMENQLYMQCTSTISPPNASIIDRKINVNILLPQTHIYMHTHTHTWKVNKQKWVPLGWQTMNIYSFIF